MLLPPAGDEGRRGASSRDGDADCQRRPDPDCGEQESDRDRPGRRKECGAGEPARARRERRGCEAAQQHSEADRCGAARVVCAGQPSIELAQRGGVPRPETEHRICALLEVDGSRRDVGDRDEPGQPRRRRVEDPVEAASDDRNRIASDVVVSAGGRQRDVDRDRAGSSRDRDQRFPVLPAGEAGDAPPGREGLQRLLSRHARPRSRHEQPDRAPVRLRPHLLCRHDENCDGLGVCRSGTGQDRQRRRARDRNPRHAETVPRVTEAIGRSMVGCGEEGAMKRREIRSWLMDMDGVLVHEQSAIPGADRFLARLREKGLPFLVLTNNSMYTRRDLTARLRTIGLDVPEEAIWTSALATANFLAGQRPGGTAFAIGEAGLTTALHDAGYTLTDKDPDYVVLGETRTYSFERISQAIRHVVRGARFIATNPDPTGPTPDGPLPATGSVAALISRASGVDPYFVGKPNPLMMRSALNAIDAHSESAAMVGDRMDTDVVSGLEAGMHTVLVLTGITSQAEAERFPYRPSRIVDSIADLIDELG